MNAAILSFTVLQVILLPIMALHDWIHLPPLTDIRESEHHGSKKGRIINSIIFGLLIFCPLMLTIVYQPYFPLWVVESWVINYGLLTLGTLVSWWLPYLFRKSVFFRTYEDHKAAFEQYKNTHHFLPPRGDNVVPNTFHVIFHLLIWITFGLALYLYGTNT